MAELQDLIDQIKEGNDKNREHLHEIERHSRNSRRHLLETKKVVFDLATNIAQMADVPEPPSDGERTEERRESQKFEELKLKELQNIARGITGLKGSSSGGSSGGGRGLMGMLGLGGAGIAAMAATALKGAAGIVAMGVAIPAFFGGLLAGDAALSWMQSIGADFNYNGLKAAALGFSDMILAMDVKAFAVLGSIMAVSAIGGTKGAKGLGAMGIAISAFLAGLLVGDALIAGADSMGWVDLNFAALKTAMVGFSDVILGLSVPAATALGAVIAAGAAGGIFSKKPTDMAVGVAALGAGISGFFIGLAVGDKAMGWLNTDFQSLPKAVKGFSDSVANLSTDAIVALGLIVGAGSIFGKITDEKTKAKMVLGVGALSAGIAAFFAGFAAADFVAANVGDGSSVKNLVKNFADAIGYLSPTTLTALGGLLAVGGIFGAVPGGLAAATGAAVGMGVIGAGIAAFFLAFEGMTKVADAIGIDGSNTKELTKNMAEGLRHLTDLNGDNLLKLSQALPGLGGGIAAFFGADALGGITSTAKDAYNYLFGTSEDNKFQQMVDALEPLKDIDPDSAKNFNMVMKDLGSLADFNPDKLTKGGNAFKNFANKLKMGIPDLELALYGGERFMGRDVVGLANGGPDLELAIKNLNELQLAANGNLDGRNRPIVNNYNTFSTTNPTQQTINVPGANATGMNQPTGLN